MKVLNFKSQCSPGMNAEILRCIEGFVCRFRDTLPNGWRCCIEFQRSVDKDPYYLLDVQSNKGGGEFAPIKMEMLKLFPQICGTGIVDRRGIVNALRNAKNVPIDFFNRMVNLSDDDLTEADWEELKKYNITHWYGGIRIPYDILVTEAIEPLLASETPEQYIVETKGEIRIAFSGAKEWQDTFFCFSIFERLQTILNTLWENDQIWYNLRGFKDNPCLQFWVEAMGITEAMER